MCCGQGRVVWLSQADFEKKGGRLVTAHAIPGRRSARRLEDLTLSTGDRLAADTFVFACGPWLRKVFPGVLDGRLRTPRRVVFFCGTPPGDARFSYPNFPDMVDARWIRLSRHRRPGLQGCARHRRCRRHGEPSLGHWSGRIVRTCRSAVRQQRACWSQRVQPILAAPPP